MRIKCRLWKNRGHGVVTVWGGIFGSQKTPLTRINDRLRVADYIEQIIMTLQEFPRFLNNILGLFDIHAGQSITAQSGDHYRKSSNNKIPRIRRLAEHRSDGIHLGFI